MGVIFAVGGLAVMTRTWVILDGGWVGAVPKPLQFLSGAILALFGFFLVIPGLLWMRGAQLPVVHFEPDHVAIRGSMIPKTFVVDRDAVSEVFVLNISNIGHELGIWPMVLIRTAEGRGSGVQYLYDGDPAELAADVARWASVRVGSTRRGIFWEANEGEMPRRRRLIPGPTPQHDAGTPAGAVRAARTSSPGVSCKR
jgi:hypothetical protein